MTHAAIDIGTLVASGVSIRTAAKLAGCSFGGLAKAIARKRKEALK